MRRFSFLIFALVLSSALAQDERLDEMPQLPDEPEDVPLKSDNVPIPEDDLEDDTQLMQVGATTMDIDGDVVDDNNAAGGAGPAGAAGAAGAGDAAGGAGPAGHEHEKFAKQPDEKDPALMKALNAIVADLTVQGNGVVKNRKWLESVQEMLESYANKYNLVAAHVKKLKFDMSNLALTKRKIHNVEVQQEIKKHIAMVKSDITDVENILGHVTNKYDVLGEKIDGVKSKIKGLKARLKKLKPNKEQRVKETKAEEDAEGGGNKEGADDEKDESALVDIEGDEIDAKQKKADEEDEDEDEEDEDEE